MEKVKTYKEIFEGICSFFQDGTYEKYINALDGKQKQLPEFYNTITAGIYLKDLQQSTVKDKLNNKDYENFVKNDGWKNYIVEHSSDYESKDQIDEEKKRIENLIKNRNIFTKKMETLKKPFSCKKTEIKELLETTAVGYRIVLSLEDTIGRIKGKSAFIMIRDDKDNIMRRDAGEKSSDSGKRGLYAYVAYDFVDTYKKISINLCFGSEDPTAEYSKDFYEKTIEKRIKEIQKEDEYRINGIDENNITLCSYIFDYDKIIKRDDFDKIFTDKLQVILDLYSEAINWMVKEHWYEEYKKYKPNITPKERHEKTKDGIKGLIKKEDDKTNDIINILLNNNRQIILYGPPGTGKTRLAKKISEYLLAEKNGDNYKKAELEENNERYMLVQFHPGYSYSEFVETISMSEESTKDNIKYGKFREMLDKAKEDEGSFYVLIIDEINRASVSETFGEILYGLEYRDGIPVETSVSHKPLVVPDNLFIICTMNTADRSLQSLDYALRRRFYFVPVYSEKPKPYKDKEYYTLKDKDKVFMNWIYDIVKTSIENSCARGVDPQDIMPGVSYFLVNSINGSYDEEHLYYKLDYELIPLLEEYMKNGMFSKRLKLEDIGDLKNKSLFELLQAHKYRNYIDKQIEQKEV